jgi:hypothetical protein
MQWDKKTILDILDMPYGMSGQLLNSKIICKMLLSLYARQTNDEQQIHLTRHHNGVGFNMFDSKYLTEVALQAKQTQKIPINELEEVASRLTKYHRQLVDIASSRQLHQKEVA